jgi:3-oxoacyl-[acyl-carrier-protein] synthase-1
MSAKVFVAGLGIVSAIGNDLQANFRSLCEEKAGIGEMQWLSSSHREELPVGEVKCSNTELAEATGLSVKLPRTALLSSLTAREALLDAGWTNNRFSRNGFISANTVAEWIKLKISSNYFQQCQKG